MYVPVKGGERAIAEAHALLAKRRRGSRDVADLELAQVDEQLALAVDRVMNEGSLYDRGLASLAIKQARGDLIEAAFLLRAFRTTLPRFGYTQPLDTSAMRIERRVSATFKDVPGGQVLGATFDYTHRLLDFSLAVAEAGDPDEVAGLEDGPGSGASMSAFAGAPVTAARVSAILDQEGLIEPPDGAGSPADSDQRTQSGALPPRAGDDEIGDITREAMAFPASRDRRLQRLARGDEGYLLALGYSTQRGYGRNHPFAGEIRIGEVDVCFTPPDLGLEITLASIPVTECEMVNQFKGSKSVPPQFTRGYGLGFGHVERKAMAMALVDRALRAGELEETVSGPAQDQEFALSHCDNVEATGFVEHLKLPHYVDFQAELDLIRQMRSAIADDAATDHVSAPEPGPQSLQEQEQEQEPEIALGAMGVAPAAAGQPDQSGQLDQSALTEPLAAMGVEAPPLPLSIQPAKRAAEHG